MFRIRILNANTYNPINFFLVLRGDKARFQLFGDTVNTAARMESTGIAGRIQCSVKTADLIIASGRSDWLSPRSEVVEVKGKGR